MAADVAVLDAQGQAGTTQNPNSAQMHEQHLAVTRKTRLQITLFADAYSSESAELWLLPLFLSSEAMPPEHPSNILQSTPSTARKN